MTRTWDPELACREIEALTHLEGALLPILHRLQEVFGYIPAEAVTLAASALNLSRAEVHGVVSFYHDFRTEAPARLVVRLCQAEACQAAGARAAAAALLGRLKTEFMKVAPDGSVVVEPVYCLGLCAAAPTALIGGRLLAALDGTSLCEAVEAAL